MMVFTDLVQHIVVSFIYTTCVSTARLLKTLLLTFGIYRLGHFNITNIVIILLLLIQCFLLLPLCVEVLCLIPINFMM